MEREFVMKIAHLKVGKILENPRLCAGQDKELIAISYMAEKMPKGSWNLYHGTLPQHLTCCKSQHVVNSQKKMCNVGFHVPLAFTHN